MHFYAFDRPTLWEEIAAELKIANLVEIRNLLSLNSWKKSAIRNLLFRNLWKILAIRNLLFRNFCIKFHSTIRQETQATQQ